VEPSKTTGRLTAKVPAQHEIQDEEAVLVVLEGVAHIDNERVVDLGGEKLARVGDRFRSGKDLFKKAPLLYDVGNCLHLDTLCFIDVLESIELASLLMLNHTDLDAG
jgi:hypothetical protein